MLSEACVSSLTKASNGCSCLLRVAVASPPRPPAPPRRPCSLNGFAIATDMAISRPAPAKSGEPASLTVKSGERAAVPGNSGDPASSDESLSALTQAPWVKLRHSPPPPALLRRSEGSPSPRRCRTYRHHRRLRATNLTPKPDAPSSVSAEWLRCSHRHSYSRSTHRQFPADTGEPVSLNESLQASALRTRARLRNSHRHRSVALVDVTAPSPPKTSATSQRLRRHEPRSVACVG